MSEENVYFDEWGEAFVLDEEGNRRPPLYAGEEYKKTASGFTYYDKPGYCGLCGRLTCRGECFK